MSISDPFAGFDLTPYQSTPVLPLQSLIVLSKALSARTPDSAADYIKQSEQAMRTTTTEAEGVMVDRLRESNEVSLADDLALDTAVDGVYVLGRDRLRLWSRYLKEGLKFLLTDPTLDFQSVCDKAARAEQLADKLFADNLLDLLGRSYTEQSQLTANLLRLIDEDGHTDELGDLAGPELLPILRRCQVRYEAMVDRRNVTRSRIDLRVVRTLLARRILSYSSMVVTMLDETKPESKKVVEEALLPMVSIRLNRSSPSADLESVLGTELAAAEPTPADG
jgi:hypothetical protein